MLTWSELRTEILAADDLSEEVFISPEELMVYANDALRSIEKDIHAIGGEKYFEDYADTTLVADQADYTLPSNIYAFKTRGIFYINGDYGYEVLPITKKQDMLVFEDQSIRDNNMLRYKFFNTPIVLDGSGNYVSGGAKITLFPKPQVGGKIRIFYIRQVGKITADTSIIEIPEGREFTKMYCIEKALKKERMSQDQGESDALKQERQRLIESLSLLNEDTNNELDVDLSFYAEHE